MEERVKGIVVKTIDYKEADKLASIFTLERGLISAKFTGVKREKAKLKSFTQPFVFADFILNKNGNLRTVTSASLIDNFSGIVASYDKTICGYIVLDMIRSILPSEKEEPDIFLLTLSALKNIEEKDPKLATIDFVLKFIDFAGMGLSFDLDNIINLDKTTGNFTDKKEYNSVQIDKKVYSLIKNINDGIEVTEKNNLVSQALRLLHNILYIKFNVDLKSFEFI